MTAEIDFMKQKDPARRLVAVPLMQQGFTLIELMVALALGLLVSIGIIALFQSTSNTNRVQDAQARVQENGRYAMSRLIDDMRMGFGQPLAVNAIAANQSVNTELVQAPMIAPMVYVANIASLLPRWRTGDTVVPAGWSMAQPYPLSPRWLIQGHECSVTGSACNPSVPTDLPAVGTVAGSRVQGADVLTVRYIGSPGWTIAQASGGGATGSEQHCPAAGQPNAGFITDILVRPAPGEPATNFASGDLALLWNGNQGAIFKVNAAGLAGSNQTLTPIDVLPTGGIARIRCADIGSLSTVTVYNFSRDLRTATYFLQLIADPSPDANPANRVIPALMRWVEGAPLNTRVADILATGVERMDFLYGTEQLASASTTPFNFLDANQVQTTGSSANCPIPPVQYVTWNNYAGAMDSNCLWRAVRTIEVHLLINTINDIPFLSQSDEAYRYSVNGGTALSYVQAQIPTGTVMPNGLQRGRMMRREFTAQIAVRNSTP